MQSAACKASPTHTELRAATPTVLKPRLVTLLAALQKLPIRTERTRNLLLARMSLVPVSILLSSALQRVTALVSQHFLRTNPVVAGKFGPTHLAEPSKET